LIFGGYGKKRKHRGDVFFPCKSCNTVNTFGLVESYGYGQLYGVRIAKVGTNRYMLCSHCRQGYNLTKEQWQQMMVLSREIKHRSHLLTEDVIASYAVSVGRILSATHGERVTEILGSTSAPAAHDRNRSDAETAERAKAKDKLDRLVALANRAGTPAEREAALARAEQIAAKYGFTIRPRPNRRQPRSSFDDPFSGDSARYTQNTDRNGSEQPAAAAAAARDKQDQNIAYWQAYDHGVRAFWDGQKLTDNPYRQQVGRVNFPAAWRDGWSRAATTADRSPRPSGR
jgi:hypothetical protein